MVYRPISFVPWTDSPGMDAFTQGFLGGMTGFVIALGIFIAVLFVVALYIYHALAWQMIARKLKHRNPWLAWIPFANISQILQLGGFHWAWVFLVLIPLLGWIPLVVLLIISLWHVFEKRRYPGWFSLGLVIPQVGLILYLVTIGFVAWSNKR